MFFYQVDLLGGKGRQHVRVLRGLRGAEQLEIGEDEEHSDHSDEGGDVAKVASVGKVKSPSEGSSFPLTSSRNLTFPIQMLGSFGLLAVHGVTGTATKFRSFF